jgi:uncharacterized protein
MGGSRGKQRTPPLISLTLHDILNEPKDQRRYIKARQITTLKAVDARMTINADALALARDKIRYRHDTFGDMTRKDAVVMQRCGAPGEDYREDTPLYIHLTVTGRCNARCRDCINTSVTTREQGDRKLISSVEEVIPERDARAIVHIAMGVDADTVVCLYGGEPFLVTDKIHRLMRILAESPLRDRVRYMVYTNGELLIPAIRDFPEVVRGIWLYALGIDGREEQHNAIRLGTQLSRIHHNLEALRAIYQGNILTWATLREEQSLEDCFEEFMFLYEKGISNHFFWHWVETEGAYENFPAYIQGYEKDLRMIMKRFIACLEDGTILPIAHINELILYLLTGRERGTTSCGVEVARNYDIMGGRIHACADLPEEMAIGVIDDEGLPHIREHSLASLVEYKKVLGCADCGVHPYCGGRCPVQALTGNPERLLHYCQLMRVHVGIVQESMSRIKEAMQKRGITAQMLYDRSAVIAQFTDVTP